MLKHQMFDFKFSIVLKTFSAKGKVILILDTSINHVNNNYLFTIKEQVYKLDKLFKGKSGDPKTFLNPINSNPYCGTLNCA